MEIDLLKDWKWGRERDQKEWKRRGTQIKEKETH